MWSYLTNTYLYPRTVKVAVWLGLIYVGPTAVISAVGMRSGLALLALLTYF